MTYRVESAPIVDAQLDAVPAAAQAAYYRLLKRIAADPWDAQPLVENPLANMRQAAFGDRGQGLAVYVVLDREERVVVVRLTWMS